MVMLNRPFARLLLLADAEKKYASPASRRREKTLLREQILGELPRDLRGSLRTQRARLVTTQTWGTHPFEFAHFTDAELASGMTAMAGSPFPAGRTALMAALAAERAKPPATNARGGPNVENAWSGWGGRRFGKPQFADQMWPILERKIKRALQMNRGRPPIMRSAQLAVELAAIPRSGIALSRSRRPRR